MEAVAKHDFVGNQVDELSFKKADVIKVLSKDDDVNWYKAEKEGKEGYIPHNYIEMKPHPWFVGKISRDEAVNRLMEKRGDKYRHPDGTFLVRNSESHPGEFSISVKCQDEAQHFKVLRDGNGHYFLWVVKFNSINELIEYHRSSSVNRGQTVLLKDMVEDTCGYDEQIMQMQMHGGHGHGHGEQMRILCCCEALYDFTGEGEEELTFQKGERINLINEIDNNWWKGVSCKGHTVGLFPAAYVKKIQRNL